MNYADWYTDTVDIYRITASIDGNLTRHDRKLVTSQASCRIYQSDSKSPTMEQTAANIKEEMKLACDNAVDIQSGDELIITRGGRLGHTDHKIRAFAGSPNYYFEPFGAVIPGLAHQEIRLLNQERIQNESETASRSTEKA